MFGLHVMTKRLITQLLRGTYAVMVSGDSEYCDGHLVYAFDDYQSWASFSLDEDNGLFKGDHDEEDDTIFAYYGPINIPNYEAP